MFVYGMTVYVENLKDCMCRKSQGIYKMKVSEQKKNLNQINRWCDYPLASNQHQFLHLHKVQGHPQNFFQGGGHHFKVTHGFGQALFKLSEHQSKLLSLNKMVSLQSCLHLLLIGASAGLR